MSDVTDRLGIARPARPLFAIHQLVGYGSIFGLRLFKLPQQNIILLNNHRTRCAVDLGFFQQARPDSGAGGNRPDRTVFEFDRRHADIFHFDTFMPQSSRHRVNFCHVSHQPVQQVDIMNRLIHIGPAPIQIPGPAPTGFHGRLGPFRLWPVIIRLCSPPFDKRVTQGQFSKSSFRDRLFQGNISGTESRLKNRAEQHTIPFAGLQNRVTAFQGNFHRFFHDHMLFGLSRLDRRIHMGTAGRADRDNTDCRIRQHLIQVVIGGHSWIRRGKRVSRCRNAVKAGDQFGPLHPFNRFGMKIGDHSATDDPEPDLRHSTRAPQKLIHRLCSN